MTPEVLDELLHAWGRAYGERRGAEWDEERSPTGDSPTARGLPFAPGTRDAATKRLTSMTRGGFDRRALMHAFAAAGADGAVALAPTWACDPVRFRETRQYQSAEPRYSPIFTSELERVQDAWLALRRHNLLTAECLRVQFQVRGLTQVEKSELVTANIRIAVGLKRYRDEIRTAKTWMHARLAP